MYIRSRVCFSCTLDMLTLPAAVVTGVRDALDQLSLPDVYTAEKSFASLREQMGT